MEINIIDGKERSVRRIFFVVELREDKELNLIYVAISLLFKRG